jgi:predicted N-acyltransferase
MYVDCCRRWNARQKLSARFLETLRRLGGDDVHIWLADLEGKVVAGLLNVSHRDAVVSWGNVSVEAGRRVGANNLLHATAIEAACARGVSNYSFGANPGLPGVDVFKRSFAVRPHEYRVYRFEKPWFRLARTMRCGFVRDKR